MKYFLLCLVFALTACNGGEENPTPKNQPNQKRAIYSSNPDDYVNHFLDLSVEYGVVLNGRVLNVQFIDLASPVIGNCDKSVVGVATVSIDEFFWENADPRSREQVVFHELAHCLMDKPSKNGKIYYTDHGSEGDISIMSDTHISLVSYSVNYKAYLDDLFLDIPVVELFYNKAGQFPYELYKIGEM